MLEYETLIEAFQRLKTEANNVAQLKRRSLALTRLFHYLINYEGYDGAKKGLRRKNRQANI